MTTFRLRFALVLLGCLVLAGAQQTIALPSPDVVDRVQLGTDTSADRLQLAQAQPAPSPTPTPAAQVPDAAAPAPAATEEPIGNVATLTGTATVVHNKNSIALKPKDDIFLNDTVQTSTGASLDVTFNDGTTFHLSANAKITIDSYVYEEGGSKNAGLFDVGKGTVAFVAASLAKTGDMHINTPTAVLGIRGTTGLVEVAEGGANANNIKLYPDADGRVGQIEVNDRQGARLGTLTQGASGFSIRPGTGGARFAAVPLAISPQQAARDQGIVRQVHAAQTVGRQIVTEQRAIRRANPPGQPGRPPGQQPRLQPNQQQPPRQPGQPQPGTPKGERQGTAPQPGAPKGEKQTPTTPNGQKQTPGGTPSPAAPNRQGNQQGQQQQPPGAGGQGATTQHELQPKQPAVQPPPTPGVQHPAAAPHPQPKQPRLSAPQKGKKKK